MLVWNAISRRRRAVICAAAVPVVTLAVAGGVWASSGSATGLGPTHPFCANKPASALTLDYAVQTLGNPVYISLTNGARAEAKALGLNVATNFHVLSANLDLPTQVNQLQDAATQKIDIVDLHAIDVNGMAAPVRTALNAGVQVIPVGEAIPNVPVYTTIVFSEQHDGFLAGQAMAQRLPNGGNIVVMGGIPGEFTSQARVKGFLQGIASNKKIKVIATGVGQYTTEAAQNAMQDILTAHPQTISGVYAANDEMLLGIINSLKAVKRIKGTVLVGNDGIPAILQDIKSGLVAADMAENVNTMGRDAVKAGVYACEGKSLASIHLTGTLITKANVAQAYALEGLPTPKS